MIYQNYRVTVEDDAGQVLGTAVWQWSENTYQTIGNPLGEFNSEAFAIQHPVLGKLYVTRGPNSGWGRVGGREILSAYQKAHLIGPVVFRYPSSNTIGIEGSGHLTKMTKRIKMPIENTPCVVQFADETNWRSARIVMTYSKTEQAEVNLSFFPTHKRQTNSGNIEAVDVVG